MLASQKMPTNHKAPAMLMQIHEILSIFEF